MLQIWIWISLLTWNQNHGFGHSGLPKARLRHAERCASAGLREASPWLVGKKANPPKKPKPTMTKPNCIVDQSSHRYNMGFFPSPLIFFLFPKVRHRWCELIVKHKYVPAYGEVEKFLREDQVSYG